MRARMRADRPRVYVVLALALACAWYAPDANALTVRDQAAGAGLAQTTSTKSTLDSNLRDGTAWVSAALAMTSNTSLKFVTL